MYQLRKMAQKSSKTFRKTRIQNQNELAEDYTELILELTEERGEARITELARRLGVSHVTALRAVKRLSRLALVSAQPRMPVSLTHKGMTMALRARQRHRMLVAFLVSLGVSNAVAECDAEGIEHHVSDTTLRAIRSWLSRHHK